MPDRLSGICAFCQREGRETRLSEEWMKIQMESIDPGRPLACRGHLLEQQLHIRKQETGEREAFKKRHR